VATHVEYESGRRRLGGVQTQRCQSTSAHAYNFDLGDNNLEIRGNVYNLFDADYISQKDSFGYYLGIGRTFNISARYNF
jgi:outer membrane receptor for ferric coprogen and ferric-rhodotorulic acid